jgi:two-component system, OmpR family, phosphate regulon sensor histidine kinase PhoR
MKRPLKPALGGVSLIGGLTLCWTAAFYVSEWLYRVTGFEPSDLVSQLIAGFGGFFIFGVLISIIGRFIRSKEKDLFIRLIEAMKRISKGDFNVAIDVQGAPGVFTELVDGMNHMAVELGQMEQMRQEFISNVSHEIQSPLASIGGFARALQKEEISGDTRRHYLEIIETECKRLSKLSDNLLKLTSLESGHHPFERKACRLDKQLKGLILLTEPQWSGKNIEMIAELEEVTAIGDEELLSQVWINLLHNSVKFTPEGGSITVRLRHGEGGGAVVEIADTGSGMSSEDREHIFERFYKADKSRNRSLGGSGLGLAIVRNILDKHKADIRVDSEPGQGTTMTVKLPVDR